EVIARFLDRAPVERFLAAASSYAAESEASHEWVEAGALTEAELAEYVGWAKADPGLPEGRRLRAMAEWLLLMPALPADVVPLEQFAHDSVVPEDLRHQAVDWMGWAMWGLWEIEAPDAGPGVALTELVTGIRLYAEVP